MHKSNIIVFYGIKYFPLIFSLLLIIIGFWIMIDPTFEITVNDVKRKAVTSDCIVPFILALLLLIFHFTFSQRVVRMIMTNRFINFKFKGKTITKEWTEVESMNKCWSSAPTIYKIRFKDENKTYFFNSGKEFTNLLGFVFDNSEMGIFLKNQKRKMQV